MLNERNQETVFSQEYYSKVIKENGYSDVDFNTVNFSLENFDVESMRRRFLCHHNGDFFAEKARYGEASIVTTGFGMSGYPHLGSISQIIKITELNNAGMNTQVVLGDLDAYNARGQSLGEVLKYRSQFMHFIENVGYKSLKGSILRDQYSHPEVNHTAYLISKYLTDADFDNSSEDIANIYEKEGIYNGWSFGMKQALTLMIADFIHLHTHHGYNNIMVMLGLEEHKYVKLASEVVSRMKLPINLAGIYGKVIRGLSGYPKMSKSLKGSAIDVMSSPDEIRSLLLNEPRSERSTQENATFQILDQVSYYSSEEMDQLAYLYQHGSDTEWHNAIESYVNDILLPLLGKW